MTKKYGTHHEIGAFRNSTINARREHRYLGKLPAPTTCGGNHHYCHFLAGDGESCFPCRKLLPDSKYPRTWLHVQDEPSLQHCIQRFWWTASMKSLILWTEVLTYIIAIVFVIFHFLAKNHPHFFSFEGYDVRRIVDNWRCNHLRHFTKTGKYPPPPPHFQ